MATTDAAQKRFDKQQAERAARERAALHNDLHGFQLTQLGLAHP